MDTRPPLSPSMSVPTHDDVHANAFIFQETFRYDVALAYDASDRPIARALAGRLAGAGLSIADMGSDEITAERSTDGYLTLSRTLLLCLSAHSSIATRARLEGLSFLFRDPQRPLRRLILLRLDHTEATGTLGEVQGIRWAPSDDPRQFERLVKACQPPPVVLPVDDGVEHRAPDSRTRFAGGASFTSVCFDEAGRRALGGGRDIATLWDLSSHECLSQLADEMGSIWAVAISADQRFAVTGAQNGAVRLWDLLARKYTYEASRRSEPVRAVALSKDCGLCVSVDDGGVALWNLANRRRIEEAALDKPRSVAFCNDDNNAILAVGRTVQIWSIRPLRCLRIFEGHTGLVTSLAVHNDRRSALSADNGGALRLWDLDTGVGRAVLNGHRGIVKSLSFTHDGRFALSGSYDGTVRLWNLSTGKCVAVLGSELGTVAAVSWNYGTSIALAVTHSGTLVTWELGDLITSMASGNDASSGGDPAKHVLYTNAKVLMVGDTSAGKTGLSRRLALDEWKPSDSTVGAWATQWKLDANAGDGVEREIWLWDFGGQADQRLIHQLFMDDAALAILVFDGQREGLLDTLAQWDRDLRRGSKKAFAKLLVAGRIDAGSLRFVSHAEVDDYAARHGYSGFYETSAKHGTGCDALRAAVLNTVPWDEIPWRSSPALFRTLKEEIIAIKDTGRVLLRFNELRDALLLELAGRNITFSDDELRAVVGLLSGPGVVWELNFGTWILLQPETINAYGQATITTLREDQQERGCILEERVLGGDLTYQSSMARLKRDDERIVLIAMHQILVEKGHCLREHTDQGTLLVFPSFYKRERPELSKYPAPIVSYVFQGYLDEIYATLVVRLHHTSPFERFELWRYAAEFRTLTGHCIGIALSRRDDGAGELKIYCDPATPHGELMVFARYVHEHLYQNASEIERLRHYVCRNCGTAVENRAVAMRKLAEGKKDIVCVDCERRIALWDDMEERFADEATKKRVSELQQQSATVLDNESKERALVGEVISTVALAGQISREFNVSDHGIDMEIEFKSDAGEATGIKLYLQLKSGDSYLRERARDQAEIFTIRDQRHAQYWMAQAFPVLLVIRASDGKVRWMEVRDWLTRESETGTKPVGQIRFVGEDFGVMSVRRWRDRMLAGQQG